MVIYPAIDLRHGKCVRLYQGDYARETCYHDDPATVVKQFVSEGATWLHLVDLDGAKNPTSPQTLLIEELIQTSQISIQTGGGIRTREQIENLLAKGAARVILGSIAVTHPHYVLKWFKYFGPERIVLALDVILNPNGEPHVAIEGWQKRSACSFINLITSYQSVGLKHFLCTNIARDGTLQGPDGPFYEKIMREFPFLELQASGGIQSVLDIQWLREKNISGAVIGRALYENKFTLREVLSC